MSTSYSRSALSYIVRVSQEGNTLRTYRTLSVPVTIDY
jgi:hypothetical protein